MNNQNKFIRDENELLNGDEENEDFYGNYEKEAVIKNVKKNFLIFLIFLEFKKC